MFFKKYNTNAKNYFTVIGDYVSPRSFRKGQVFWKLQKTSIYNECFFHKKNFLPTPPEIINIDGLDAYKEQIEINLRYVVKYNSFPTVLQETFFTTYADAYEFACSLCVLATKLNKEMKR